jgi:hypothetical protein
MFNSFAEPDPHQSGTVRSTILLVGPDDHGHWLVQEEGGSLEGSFVSQAEAMRFARWERHAFPFARIELSAAPLVSRTAR